MPEATVPTSSGSARLVGLCTGALGAYLLVRPEGLPDALAPHESAPPSPVVRVLGLRSMTQGGVIVAMPTRSMLAIGAGVDALHALSMVGVALFGPRHRRCALASAAVAAVSAAAEAHLASSRRGSR